MTQRSRRAPRMERTWSRFSTGAVEGSLPGASVTRLFMTSVIEGELNRDIEPYTVTRVIFILSFDAQTSVDIVTCGILMQNELIPVTTETPVLAPHADWMYHEEFRVGTADSNPHQLIIRDVRGQRKVRGRDTELYFYLENRGATTVDYHLSGNALLLGV